MCHNKHKLDSFLSLWVIKRVRHFREYCRHELMCQQRRASPTGLHARGAKERLGSIGGRNPERFGSCRTTIPGARGGSAAREGSSVWWGQGGVLDGCPASDRLPLLPESSPSVYPPQPQLALQSTNGFSSCPTSEPVPMASRREDQAPQKVTDEWSSAASSSPLPGLQASVSCQWVPAPGKLTVDSV